MLYDLNKKINPDAVVDSFKISGYSYELGPISYTIKHKILEIDNSKDLIPQIRPIVEKLMKDWNDNVHDMKDTEIEAIFKLIINRLNGTNNQ